MNRRTKMNAKAKTKKKQKTIEQRFYILVKSQTTKVSVFMSKETRFV